MPSPSSGAATKERTGTTSYKSDVAKGFLGFASPSRGGHGECGEEWSRRRGESGTYGAALRLSWSESEGGRECERWKATGGSGKKQAGPRKR
jgi:hypothetical protein